MKTSEALLERGLFFVGDVKTGYRRFPSDALELATAEERGAWAVYTSSLTLSNGEQKPVYGITHRRGETVHKFVATAGTSLPGQPHRATFADDENKSETAANYVAMQRLEPETRKRIHHHHHLTRFDFLHGKEIERKCPKVLNFATTAQPACDRHNRYRQFILALEKRLLTNSFSTRFASFACSDSNP